MQLKRWSPAEIDTISKQIDLSPNNLSEAFEKSAQFLGRTTQAISMKWYSDLRKKKTLVVTASKKTQIASNVKNTPRFPIYNNNNEVVDFKSVMRDVIKLPKKELTALKMYIDCL